MPNQGVPVIFKNKVAYGYAEKSVQAYDVSVSDYNALTEQQQLDGSIRFIQGVDAVPNGNNVWAKLGTTPLAEGLPRDCSQAVNELKSNLTELDDRKIYKVSTSNTLSGGYVTRDLGSNFGDSGTYYCIGASAYIANNAQVVVACAVQQGRYIRMGMHWNNSYSNSAVTLTYYYVKTSSLG